MNVGTNVGILVGAPLLCGTTVDTSEFHLAPNDVAALPSLQRRRRRGWRRGR
jgi:hypothetical protein